MFVMQRISPFAFMHQNQQEFLTSASPAFATAQKYRGTRSLRARRRPEENVAPGADLALATGGSNADVANDHALAVHARVSVSPLTSSFAFIAVIAFVQIND